MADVYKWKLDPSQNNSSDPDINWSENQPPSTVNNSARAMMEGVARWRDQLNGTISSTGTGLTAIIQTGQNYTAANMPDGLRVTWRQTANNTAPTFAPTQLNVDGALKKLIQMGKAGTPSATTIVGVNLFDLRANTIYEAVFNRALDAFQLLAPPVSGSAIAWAKWQAAGGSISFSQFYGVLPTPTLNTSTGQITVTFQNAQPVIGAQGDFVVVGNAFSGGPLIFTCRQVDRTATTFIFVCYNTANVPMTTDGNGDFVVHGYRS